MIHTKLFKQAFLLLCVVAFLSIVGDFLYLFNSIWWYDIPLHIMAGCCVAMAASIGISYFRPDIAADKQKLIFTAVVITLIIGVAYECYELYFGITFLSDGIAYIFDTTKDITDDIIGGIIGAFYSFKILYQIKNQIKNNG